jgi:hypothetical protein
MDIVHDSIEEFWIYKWELLIFCNGRILHKIEISIRRICNIAYHCHVGRSWKKEMLPQVQKVYGIEGGDVII